MILPLLLTSLYGFLFGQQYAIGPVQSLSGDTNAYRWLNRSCAIKRAHGIDRYHSWWGCVDYISWTLDNLSHYTCLFRGDNRVLTNWSHKIGYPICTPGGECLEFPPLRPPTGSTRKKDFWSLDFFLLKITEQTTQAYFNKDINLATNYRGHLG